MDGSGERPEDPGRGDPESTREGAERKGAERASEPRVARLSTEGNEPAVQALFDRFLEERGNVPNMFRVMGRLPDHLTSMVEHFGTVMRSGTVPRRLKEMLSVRVSALNGCRY